MKIAVCDDEKMERELLCQEIRKTWEDAEIFEFGRGCDILDLIRKGVYYDIVFLDILLSDTNGIEIGRRIRTFFPALTLVFVSNSRDFGPEAFEVNALHYLVKPCNQVQLAQVKKRYQCGRERKAVIRLGKDQTQEIPCYMITYIESVHNNLLIHLFTGTTVKVRGSLCGFTEQVDDRFLRVNRGVLINMEAIEQMNTDSCQVSGMTFALSRKERAANKRRYNNWLFQRALGEQQFSV